MGDRASTGRVGVHFEYCVDRLLAAKLEHAYELLVPDHRWRVGVPAPPAQETVNESPHRDLRPRVVGSPARE